MSSGKDIKKYDDWQLRLICKGDIQKKLDKLSSYFQKWTLNKKDWDKIVVSEMYVQT